MDEYRLKYLEKKYSETNVSYGEELPKSTISRINKNYHSNQKRRRVDGVLNDVKNKDSIKEEVHQFVASIPDLNVICRSCTEEQIVAVIILYVQKVRNTRFYPERNRLWNKYDLNWKTYSLILLRLLQHTRENSYCFE